MGIPANHPAILEAQRRGLIPSADLVKPRRKSPDVRTSAKRKWSITLTLDCRAISEANRPNEHWNTKRRRKQIQGEALTRACRCIGFDPGTAWYLFPVVVTWTHFHKPGKAMDAHENLPMAFKSLVDSLTRLMGVESDADPRIVWRYEQRTGEPCVEVRIESAA